MRYFLSTFILFFCLTTMAQRVTTSLTDHVSKASRKESISSGITGFVENKGQIMDQFGNSNPAVLFLLNTNGLNVQLRQDGFSYDTYQVLPGTKELSPKSAKFDPAKVQKRITNYHRVDVYFEGITKGHVINPLKRSSDEIRYNGDTEVTTYHFKEVVYEDLYPNIDLRFYFTDAGKFEYDFIVKANADPSKIQLRYDGQNNISMNSRSEISLKVAHGDMTERMPVSYLRETNKRVDVSYRQIRGNVFQFSIPEYDKTKTLIIDPTPTLTWATYFGGSLEDSAESITADNSDNVYAAGYTYSTGAIATSGSFQSSIGGSVDGYFVKFNSAGVRQFATYVGGAGDDYLLAILVDSSGDIFVTGSSTSTTGIATSGAQQTVNNGLYDAILMKFSNSGSRVWGTYYGGTADDFAFDITMRPAGAPIIAGRTASTDLFTPGGFQSSYGGGSNDGFYADFESPNGLLNRSSYLGGPDNDGAVKIISDGSGNVFVTGWTNSTTGIATSGTFSSTQNGLYDAFLAKYSSSTGAKSWATYFGGSDDDEGYAITLDGAGMPYISGYTMSAGIDAGGSNPGSYSGGQDIYIAKFDSFDGTGIWSSYYGGSGDEAAWSLVADNTSIYGCGETTSTSGIASSGDYQPTIGGGLYDALFFKYDSDGNRVYGSYYGSTGEEYAKYNTLDASGNLLFSGLTDSPSGMASGSSHQSTYGGGTFDAFIAKFGSGITLAPEPTAQPTNLVITAGPTDTSFEYQITAVSDVTGGYLHIYKAGSAPTFIPTDGFEYLEGELLSDGSTVQYSDNFPTGNSYSGLTAGTTYFIQVFSYNGSGTQRNYLTTNPLSATITTTGGAFASEPTDQPTNLVFDNITDIGFDYKFTAATSSPTGYIVLRSPGAAVTGVPQDGIEYVFEDVLGNATVRAHAADPGVLISASGVVAATVYHLAIFAYNGSGTAINYRQVSPLRNSVTTLGLLASEPTAQPTNLVVTDGPTFDSFTYDITPASGVGGYLHIYKVGSAPTFIPVDGVEYVTDDVLSDGSIVGYSDNVPTNNSYSGLAQGTSYFFQIFSYNGDGASRNYLTTNPLMATITTLTPDSSAPIVISNNLVTSVKAGESIKVSVTATDPQTGIDAVDIIYRVSSEIDTKSASMDNTSGDIWEFTIPSSAVKDLGVEYGVIAYNGVGLEGTTGILGVTITTADENGLTLPTLTAGTSESSYRIISVPLALTSKSVDNVFGDDLGKYGDKSKWRMFRYSSGRTNELSGSSSINPGEGYWIISSVGVSLDSGPGTTVGRISAPVTINVTQGFNQIGNPYVFNLLWSDVKEYENDNLTNASLGLGNLKTYNGSFAETTILRKFEGGFVMAASSGTLAFPAERNPAAGRTEVQPVVPMHNSIDGSDWEVAFELTNGNQTMNFGGVGMNKSANAGYDPFDDFTLPRFIDYIELNHASKELFNLSYTKDIVPSSENHTWEFSVASNSTELLTMKWDNSFFGTNSRQLVLWDMSQQRGLDMRKENQIVFSPSRSGHFKVFYGDETYVQEKTAIDQVVFHGLFPNPAKDMVTISFSVPGEDNVTIEVIDLLGRKIATVADGNFKAGYHEVSWNTQEMTNGIYITQIKSKYSDQQKRLSINK